MDKIIKLALIVRVALFTKCFRSSNGVAHKLARDVGCNGDFVYFLLEVPFLTLRRA